MCRLQPSKAALDGHKLRIVSIFRSARLKRNGVMQSRAFFRMCLASVRYDPEHMRERLRIDAPKIFRLNYTYRFGPSAMTPSRSCIGRNDHGLGMK